MRAALKRLHSPDVDLPSYWPDDPSNFGFLIQAFIGPEVEQGEESFGFILCTPKWLQAKADGRIMFGLHHLIVTDYDLNAIEQHLRRHCERCVGSSWQEIAIKLSRVGQWEFEDYRPAP
jgi:hypothetical protein